MIEETTTILHFEVDQGAAEKRLETIEKLLLDNKAASQELSKAYKAGTITQEEYVKENIRLQQNIAKEQNQKKVLLKTINTESNSRDALRLKINQLGKEYDSLNTKSAAGAKRADELQKELAQLNDQLNKGGKAAGFFKDNIGKYPDTFGPAIQNIRVAGTSIGDLGTKLASFANPATAAVGLVGALGAAYAKSTIGAKDLEFASNQLAAATTLATNAFASFISSAEDGEGIVSKFTNGIISFLGGGAFANVTKFAAALQERLQDLGRLESEIRINNNQRIEENQELLENIADEQVNINQKISDAQKIEDNLIIVKRNTLDVLKSQLSNLEAQLSLNKEDENLQNLVLAKKQEISKESSTLEKQITRINKTQDDLNAKLQKELQLKQDIFEIEVREANAPQVDLAAPKVSGVAEAAGGANDPIIQASKARQDQFVAELKTVELTEDQKRKFYKDSADIQNTIDQQRFQTVAGFAALGAALFGEQTAAYKAFASASTLISTYSAATKAYESAFLPVPTVASPALGAVNAGLAIAQGLANLAVINGVEFFDGGFTGKGRDDQAAGIVHANEYVTPAHIVRSPAAQPHLAALEGMRMRGYADGGFVTNQSTAPVQQALIMANAIKNLPPAQLSVKEVTRVQNRIAVKENISSLQ